MPEFILWICLDGGRIRVTGHLISSRQHDVANHAFETLPVIPESSGEVVEQSPMGRLRPLEPEVFAGLHQADTEELLPIAVDDHPGGQRILAIHKPARDAQAVRLAALGQGRKDRGRSRLDLAPLLLEVPPNMDVGLPLAIVGQLHHDRRGRRLEPLDLLFQLGDLRGLGRGTGGA